MTRILYREPNGSLSVIIPSGELSIADTAEKDVPAGLPYLIVEDDVVPSDRSFRDAWEADFSDPDGTSMGEAAWRAANEASE